MRMRRMRRGGGRVHHLLAPSSSMMSGSCCRCSCRLLFERKLVRVPVLRLEPVHVLRHGGGGEDDTNGRAA